ncbi:MAG: HAD hydrolase family protein [Elusimicrobiales bacterium]|nr:HAD hydrolase family protein [Elusimicrobiales bacterium]
MRIRAVALDVDGVLTDGTFTWGEGGEEYKSFSFRDVMGISLAGRSGIVFSLISGEASPLVDRFAKKMGISAVYKGCKNKEAALLEFASAHNFSLDEVCFIGDDVNDLAALAAAGFSAAPADAYGKVKAEADYVAQAAGGHGAVREILDHLADKGFFKD